MMLRSRSSSLTHPPIKNWYAAPVYPVIDAMTGGLDTHFGTPEILP